VTPGRIRCRVAEDGYGSTRLSTLRRGALRWKADQENFSWVISGPALYKGMVIVGTSDAQNIKAYDAKTGQLKWKAASPEPANIFALPTICGDTLYIGDFYGSMVWLNAFTGNRANDCTVRVYDIGDTCS